jgi:hypothetical protein
MSMLLTLLFTCLVSSVSVSFDFPCTAHAFYSERLFNRFQGLCHTFSEICTKFDAVPLLDSSRSRIRPDGRPQINERKKSACPPSYVKFCTLAPKTGYYHELPLHHATTTPVQSAAPIPDIMDTPSHKFIILSVVLYGWETWFLTLREEHRKRVFLRIGW